MDEPTDQPQSDISTAPQSTADPSKLPVINWSLVKECLGGDANVLHEFMEVVKKESSSLLADIRRAIDVSDAKLLVRFAHTLKGCVNYFGVEPLIDAALALENLGRTGKFDGAQELMATLEIEYSRFMEALNLNPPDSQL